jgi:hypothetical protein
MSERVGRSLKGIVTAALSLLIVAGPVTAALADGGPDRVLPKGQQSTTGRPGFGDLIGAPSDPVASADRPGFGDLNGATNHPAVVSERPGFGDRIQSARPGFGDHIVPTPVHVQAPAPVAVGAPAPGSWTDWTPLGLLLAALVLVAAGATMTRRFRRTPAI